MNRPRPRWPHRPRRLQCWSRIIRKFEVTPGRRLAMAGMYFGLIAFLLLGMAVTHVLPASQLEASQ
jgi:hypothetical protein